MHLAIEMFAGCTLHHGSYRRNQCNLLTMVCVVLGADGLRFRMNPPRGQGGSRYGEP